MQVRAQFHQAEQKFTQKIKQQKPEAQCYNVNTQSEITRAH
jgi:hypothetical protein